MFNSLACSLYEPVSLSAATDLINWHEAMSVALKKSMLGVTNKVATQISRRICFARCNVTEVAGWEHVTMGRLAEVSAEMSSQVRRFPEETPCSDIAHENVVQSPFHLSM